MSKFSALKEKLASVPVKVGEALDKIPFLRAWREKQGKSQHKGDPQLNLSTIYKQGSTLARLQVLAVYALAAIALVSGGLAAQRLMARLKPSTGKEQVQQEMIHALEEAQRRANEKADVLALGQFTVNAYVGEQENAMMSLDIWLRVSDPEAAAFANAKSTMLQDKAMDAINALYVEKVSFLQEKGRQEARIKILEALNSAMPKGHHVEDIYIQNLVVQ